MGCFTARKQSLAYAPSQKDKSPARLNRARRPGGRSQDLAERQNPQDFQNLAEQEEPPARPSLSTLQEVYKQYHLEESTEPKDHDVAAYVQALDSEFRSAMTRAEALQFDHDAGWKKLQSLHSSVKSVVEDKDPSPKSDKWDNIPAYISRLLDRVKKQSEIIDQKQGEIGELKIQSQRQKDIHEQRIRAQEGTYKKEKQELEEKHKLELREKDDAHDAAVARLEKSHRSAVAGLDATIATLQSGLLTTGSRFQPLTDSECKSRLGLIRTLVYSLAPSSPIIDARAYGDFFDRAESRNSEGGGNMYVLEASIWSILFNGIFSSPFRVFGKHGEIFMSSWKQLFGAGVLTKSIDSWLEPYSQSEEWRYDTVEALRNGLSKGGRLDSMHQLRASYEANLKEVRDAIASVLAKASSEDRTSEIRKIVEKSCSLALDFGIQRCRIQLFVPSDNEMISWGSPLDAFIDLNKSNKGTTGGMVLLVVKPGLRKWGDAQGGSLDTITTLCPSEVYLERADN